MKKLLVIAAAASVLTACAAGHASRGSTFVDYRPHVPRSSVTPLANRRERQAGREAEALLRRLVLPAGAVRFDRVPFDNQDLNHSDLGVSTVQMTADRYSFWRFPGSGTAAIAFERRHMFPGFHGLGGASGPDGWANEDFDGPVVNGSPAREVSVTVVPIGGQTYVRLDVGVGWIYPRSPQEVVPGGVREIDIRGGGVSERVTEPAQVRRIVRWFDALHVAQPGPSVGCELILAANVEFNFRSGGGAVLASARVPSAPATNCDTIAFSIHGKRQTPLIDARWDRDAFASRVQRLLGVTFKVPRP
jgi:hypothetical protein